MSLDVLVIDRVARYHVKAVHHTRAYPYVILIYVLPPIRDSSAKFYITDVNVQGCSKNTLLLDIILQHLMGFENSEFVRDEIQFTFD